jgi:ER-bound oxygenase mpaB/B'/Rubber oxygenase, catalytic domain
MTFGTLDQALKGARRLHRRHAAITGVMPKAAGPFPAGSHYRANETSAQRWVHATLVETALVAHDLILAPLSSGERERYYAESCILAALFGIPQTSLPSSWEEFGAYNRSMWDSETLTVTPEARARAGQILRGTTVCLRTPGCAERSQLECYATSCERPLGCLMAKPNSASPKPQSHGSGAFILPCRRGCVMSVLTKWRWPGYQDAGDPAS